MDQATPRRSFKIKAGCILGASVSDGSSSLIKYEPDIELLHTLLIQEAPFEEIVRAANGLVLRMVTVPNCKYVPEVMGMSTGPFVLSPAIRAIIDEMEPGVHTYLPITVVSDKKIQSATEHGTHFMLVPPPPIDCIILDESVMKADIQGYPKKKEGDHWGGDCIHQNSCPRWLNNRLKAPLAHANWQFQTSLQQVLMLRRVLETLQGGKNAGMGLSHKVSDQISRVKFMSFVQLRRRIAKWQTSLIMLRSIKATRSPSMGPIIQFIIKITTSSARRAG
jgi:hypothetical protein